MVLAVPDGGSTVSNADFFRLHAEQTEERERAQARHDMAERREVVLTWKRRTVKAFEHDVQERKCELCEHDILAGDVILLQSASTVPVAHPDYPVFHGECLGVAAELADPARAFNRLRDKILKTKEFYPT